MAGWTRKKRVTVEKAFYEFLNRCYVNSKDAGRLCLGESLYDGQRQAVSDIFDALEADIHDIYILKSRQLGISTIIRALVTFLLGVHPGLKGAIVFDTDANRVESRAELEVMIKDLPDSLRFPAIQGSHRQGLTLRNDSKVLFMSAGTTQRKSSGTLGRSVGLSLAHCSELCSWDNPEGLEAFQNSLSDMNPDRLYIYESTARGFNDWHTMWRDARADPLHCKCIFLGWWSKPSQRIERSHPDFMVYGEQMPTELEQFKIREVRRLYQREITPEQLAWVRRKMDPTAQREGDAPAEFIGSATRIQEQPWCVTAETRVGTERGLIPIIEALHAKRCSRGSIVAGGPTGKAAIWKVRTKLGYEFRGTANHPLITVDNERVDLSDSLGARIKLQPPMLGELPYMVSWREGPIICEVPITPDLARWVGLFMGDGSASNGYGKKGHTLEVSICCDAKDTDIIDECCRLFNSVFNAQASKNACRGWVTVRSGTHAVFDVVKKLGLTRNDIVKTMRRVHVPEFIWRSPKPIVREFLRGLFEADGFNAYETNRVALFSKYPEFIRDVQLLLLAFGITSRSVSMKKKAGDGHFYTGNQLELRTAEALKFNDEIGFLSSRKMGRCDPVAYERMWEDRIGKKGNNKRPVIVFEDEVVAAENEGVIEEVFNLTVESEHLFDANGILTHNTEGEAFQQTGSVFFAAEKLTDLTNNYVSKKFKTFMFIAGVEFIDMRIYPASNAKSVELKVWEEPDPEGYYVIAVDPAYGKKAKNCNSVIEVFRCYADGVDQVAEYAWPLITAYQLAWALASLMGWYGAGPRSEVRYILELNGPGEAVFTELRSLKFKLENTSLPTIKEEGLRDLFRNVKTYIFNRQDSLSPGHNYHFTTATRLKLSLMERFRDFASTGLTRIRSLELIEEMKTIAREGDSIGAPGTKLDDRVMATALAVHCWEEKMRRALISNRRTREGEASRKNQSVVDQITLFNQNNLEAFFKTKQKRRLTDLQLMQQRAWRYGTGRRF